MAPDTRSGKKQENRIGRILHKKYNVHTDHQVQRGKKESGKDRYIDRAACLNWNDGAKPETWALSIKHQDTSGSADDKWIGEAIDLNHLLNTEKWFAKAFLIISGPAVDERQLRYVKKKVEEFGFESVYIVSEQEFWEVMDEIRHRISRSPLAIQSI